MDLKKKRRFQHEATGCCFFLSKREGKEDDGWISDCSDRGAGEKVEIYTTRCMYVGFRLREHRKRLPRSPQTGKISTAAGRATGAHPFFLLSRPTDNSTATVHACFVSSPIERARGTTVFGDENRDSQNSHPSPVIRNWCLRPSHRVIH